MLQEDAVMLQVLQTPSVGEVCRSYINVTNYYHVLLDAHKSSYLVKQRDQAFWAPVTVIPNTVDSITRDWIPAKLDEPYQVSSSDRDSEFSFKASQMGFSNSRSICKCLVMPPDEKAQSIQIIFDSLS
jgi:hypothetical protein